MPDVTRLIADADDRRLAGASEDPIHLAILDWLRVVLPWPTNATVHHSPNGGMRNKAVAAKLKRMGTRAGWPDLSFIHEGVFYGLEVKRQGGRVKPDQRQCHHDIRTAGGKVAVARSIDDARQALADWNIPTREAA